MVLLVLYLGKCGVSKHSKVAWWWIFGEFWGVPSLKFNMEPWKWWFPIWISFSKGPLFRFHVRFGGCKDEGSPIPLLRGTSPVLVSIEENTHRSRVLDWKNKENLATFRPQKHVGLNKWRTSTFRLTFWKSIRKHQNFKRQPPLPLPPFLEKEYYSIHLFLLQVFGEVGDLSPFFSNPKAPARKSHLEGIRFVDWKSRKSGQFKYRPSEFVLICFWILKSAIWLLMDKILHQLRLVVYPIIYRVLAPYTGGCLGFQPSTGSSDRDPRR